MLGRNDYNPSYTTKRQNLQCVLPSQYQYLIMGKHPWCLPPLVNNHLSNTLRGQMKMANRKNVFRNLRSPNWKPSNCDNDFAYCNVFWPVHFLARRFLNSSVLTWFGLESKHSFVWLNVFIWALELLLLVSCATEHNSESQATALECFSTKSWKLSPFIHSLSGIYPWNWLDNVLLIDLYWISSK